MAQRRTQDIDLGITRLEYGDANRPQRAALTLATGKYYNGGLVSGVAVFWVGRYSRQQMIGLGSKEGDFSMGRIKINRETKATQKAIDRQHAEVFTPEVIEQLTQAAKAHYALVVRAGIDGYKNVYLPVNREVTI